MRPLAITVLSCIYIAVGFIALIVHGRIAIHAWHPEDLWILLTEILAIVAGVFMLRGANWARWLAFLWAGAHVVIGYLNRPSQVLVHAIIFAGIAILLFRAEARAFFRPAPATLPGA
ncbi:MAG: hypothetical protein ACLGXA_10180 [Acidobacteriota bacterium]